MLFKQVKDPDMQFSVGAAWTASDEAMLKAKPSFMTELVEMVVNMVCNEKEGR